MNASIPKQVVSELQSFAERIGLDALALNEEGYCALESDKGEVIHFQWEEAGEGCLELSALLSSLPIGAATDGFRLLLEANFAMYGSGGGWFAVRPGADEIWYFYRLELNRLTAEALEIVLAGFMEKLTLWREQLAGLGQPGVQDNHMPMLDRV